MRWPLMLVRNHRRTIREIAAGHDETISALERFHLRRVTGLVEQYQHKVDNEYVRARDEGQRQVHAWAVEVNANLFYGTSPFNNMTGTQTMRTRAALQDAEHQFRPTRTQLEETKEI